MILSISRVTRSNRGETRKDGSSIASFHHNFPDELHKVQEVAAGQLPNVETSSNIVCKRVLHDRDNGRAEQEIRFGFAASQRAGNVEKVRLFHTHRDCTR